jgi:hypothetical protein
MGHGSGKFARTAAALVGSATLLVAGAARAECGRGAACLSRWQTAREKRDQPRPSAEKPAPSNAASRWYGWQLLIIDGSVFAFDGMLLAADVPATPSLLIGTTTAGAYQIVPPLIHWRRQDHAGIGWASFGLRSSGPVLGLISSLVFFSHCPKDSDGTPNGRCVDRHALEGEIVGAVIASTLDATLLAWDPPRPAPTSTVIWSPSLRVVAGGASLGLAATF